MQLSIRVCDSLNADQDSFSTRAKPIFHAQCQLGSEFRLGCQLAPHDRPNPRLLDTDDSVFNLVATVVIHLLLLPVYLSDGSPFLFLTITQAVFIYHLFQMLQVAAQVLQLFADRSADQFTPGSLVANQKQIILASLLAICSRLGLFFALNMGLVNQFLADKSCIIENAGRPSGNEYLPGAHVASRIKVPALSCSSCSGSLPFALAGGGASSS